MDQLLGHGTYILSSVKASDYHGLLHAAIFHVRYSFTLIYSAVDTNFKQYVTQTRLFVPTPAVK